MKPLDLYKLQVEGIKPTIHNYQKPPEEGVPFEDYRGIRIFGPDYKALEGLASYIGKTLDDLWGDDSDKTKFKVKDTRIVYLDLHGCELEELPEDLYQLTSLEELDLNNNKFTYIPDSIEQLTALISLYLKKNPLKRKSKRLIKTLEKRGVKVEQ